MVLEMLLKDKGWVSFNFLEVFTLRRDTEVPEEECQNCWLAYFSHPMRKIREDSHSATFEKYCTKDFLKYNFIKSDEPI